MNTKYIVGLAAVLIVVGGGAFLLNSKSFDASQVQNDNGSQTVDIPSDWRSYQNSEWGIAFKYPPRWTMIEDKRTQEEYNTDGRQIPVGGLERITLSGDGYNFIVDKSGMGLPEDKEYSHPQYVIDGFNAKTFEDDSGTGFTIFLSVYVNKNKGFSFRVSNSFTKVKTVTDQILSTLVFE